MNELKELIIARLDPLQLLDILNIEMADLVEMLWECIVDQENDLWDAVNE